MKELEAAGYERKLSREMNFPKAKLNGGNEEDEGVGREDHCQGKLKCGRELLQKHWACARRWP